MGGGTNNGVDGETFGSFMRIVNTPFTRCLHELCSEPAVRAHSIQNARVLDLLAADGHVVTPVMKAQIHTGPYIKFERVGRNKASTFTGLCASHDSQIFRPIETSEISVEDSTHLFFLAYRAAFRELHSTMEGAFNLQRAYLERVERGLDPKDEPSEAGIFAAVRLGLAHEMYRYKAILDDALFDGDYDALVHDVVELPVDSPTLAVCSVFSADRLPGVESTLRIHLNVLPLSRDLTVAVFSYVAADAAVARGFLHRILNSDGGHQRYELSRLVLGSCENFVLNPEYFESWSDDKKSSVAAYFTRTLAISDLEAESRDFYLF